MSSRLTPHVEYFKLLTLTQGSSGGSPVPQVVFTREKLAGGQKMVVRLTPGIEKVCDFVWSRPTHPTSFPPVLFFPLLVSSDVQLTLELFGIWNDDQWNFYFTRLTLECWELICSVCWKSRYWINFILSAWKVSLASPFFYSSILYFEKVETSRTPRKKNSLIPEDSVMDEVSASFFSQVRLV
jgi:hypothetical protein